MSNKTILQNYNSRLNKNNTDLISVLNTINNLPSSGSGSGRSIIGGFGGDFGCIGHPDFLEETNYRVTEISQEDFETILGTYDFSMTYYGKHPENKNWDTYISTDNKIEALKTKTMCYIIFTDNINNFRLVEKL